MEFGKRTFTILYVVTATIFFIGTSIYLFIGFILPSPKKPESISLEGGVFEEVFKPFDGQFVSVYLIKKVSNEEGSRYVQNWKNLNSGFDRRDLTELVSLDKPLNNISRIRCLIIIDCRNGNYLRFVENLFNAQGELVDYYISSDERHNTWNRIAKNSTIDELANRFCGSSVY